MALVLTIEVTDRTSILQFGSLRVEHRAAGFISICSLTLIDLNSNITISAEDSITVVDGATTFFSGRVVDIVYRPFTTHSRYIVLQCQDLNSWLAETVIDQAKVFTAQADSAIIDSLFDDYLPAVDSETHVDTIQDPLTITLGPTTLRSALSQIATQTGGYYYVDFDNALHYFDAEANVSAWWLSDDPDQVDSFSYLDKPVRNATAVTRLDGVFVQGAGVSGWRGNHAAGHRTAIVTDNRITTSAGVTLRGDTILAEYGSPQVTYNVRTYKAGLVAGMDIRFICAIYGVDGTFTVRKINITWDGEKTAVYELELGDVMNPSLTGERIWLDTIEESVGPITAPRLPTSSKGWSHDLVFSATDNDTVAWAGGDITLADGTVYAIDAGNTGNIAAINYIFLDIDTSLTVLQMTTDSAVAVGSGKLLIAVVVNVADATKSATFKVFGGDSLDLLVAANIAANTITTNEIAANTIVAGNIAAGAIEADELAAGAVTATKLSVGIGLQTFSPADGLLLLGPGCPRSPTAWDTLRAQRATISGAYHEVLGRWPESRALMVEGAVTNLAVDPVLGEDAASWVLRDFATISRSDEQSKYEGYSLKVVTGGNDFGGAHYAPDIAIDASTDYTASIWVYCTIAGIPMNLRAVGDDSGNHNTPFTSKIGWHRYSVSFESSVGDTIITHTQVAHLNDITDHTFYLDAIQVEKKGTTTTFCYGGLEWCAWTGAEHNSTSTRAATTVDLDAHVGMLNDNNTVSFSILLQAPYDADDANWPNNAYIIDYRGADNNNRTLVFFAIATKTFNVYLNGATRLTTAAQTFKAGDWIFLTCTCDYTADIYTISVNGAVADSDTTALTAPTALTDWALGLPYNLAAGFYGGWAFDEVAVFDRILTADENAADFALGKPLTDMGAFSTPGLYLRDGRFVISTAYSGARTEMDDSGWRAYTAAGGAAFALALEDGLSWDGGTLDTNDIQIGRSANNYIKWDDSAGVVSLKGAIVITGGSGIGSLTDAGALATGDDLDDVPEGGTYGKILQTIIAAGLIQVGAGTKDGTLDGFHISATEIVGQLDGVDQVVMGTDGALIAGAGGIIIDVNGIAFHPDTGAGTIKYYDDSGNDFVGSIVHASVADTLYTLQLSVGPDMSGGLGGTGDGVIRFHAFDEDNNLAELYIQSAVVAGGSIRAAFDAGDVFIVDADGDIWCSGTITTAAGSDWDLRHVASGTITPDRKVYVTIGGVAYTLAAQLGTV